MSNDNTPTEAPAEPRDTALPWPDAAPPHALARRVAGGVLRCDACLDDFGPGSPLHREHIAKHGDTCAACGSRGRAIAVASQDATHEAAYQRTRQRARVLLDELLALGAPRGKGTRHRPLRDSEAEAMEVIALAMAEMADAARS